MSDQPKRKASEDPNPRSPRRRRTSTSADVSMQDLPDCQPEPDADATPEGSEGRRITFDLVVGRPRPDTIVPDIIISLPETSSQTSSEVPTTEEESPEAESGSAESPSSTTTSEAPEVRRESPKVEDEVSNTKDKAKDKLPKEKDESSKARDESSEVE